MIAENIISTAADCTIKQFMKCSFDEKYHVLLIDGEATDEDLRTAFELIYSEYVDYAGLYQTREFEMSAYINSLDTRIQSIRRFIELQRAFLLEFNTPFTSEFGIVKKYGHHLYWDRDYPDPEAFKKCLIRIEGKEKKYESILKTKIAELIEFRRKQVKKEFTLLQSRKDFLTMLNRLQQARFVIDKDKTSVEELALMIRDTKDQQEEEKAQRLFKRK